MIDVSVTSVPGLPAARDAILAVLPEDLRLSVEPVVRDEPVIEPEGAWGGMIDVTATRS